MQLLGIGAAGRTVNLKHNECIYYTHAILL